MNIKLRIGLIVLGVVLLLIVIAPLSGVDPNQINPDATLQAPHWGSLLGTDEMGRDLLARLGIGAQISLLIGLATALVAVLIGTAYGIVAACFNGHWIDTLMMRLIDLIYSLPGLMIVILFTIFLGRNVMSLVLALSLFSWPDTARMIRGAVLKLQQEEFVEAFYSLGGRLLRLMTKHFIPNLLGLMVLTVTITVPRAILTESTLSFLGLGIASPASSWGTMISDGWQMIRLAPHLLVFPSVFLLLTVLGLNFLGDGLKETFEH